jgi:hypothetical protein
MKPQYRVKQQVVIKPPDYRSPDPRSSTLDKYAGQVGTIVNYYWISTHLGGTFYTYMVKVESTGDEIVVHEDEIKELWGLPSKGIK